MSIKEKKKRSNQFVATNYFNFHFQASLNKSQISTRKVASNASVFIRFWTGKKRIIGSTYRKQPLNYIHLANDMLTLKVTVPYFPTSWKMTPQLWAR